MSSNRNGIVMCKILKEIRNWDGEYYGQYGGRVHQLYVKFYNQRLDGGGDIYDALGGYWNPKSQLPFMCASPEMGEVVQWFCKKYRLRMPNAIDADGWMVFVNKERKEGGYIKPETLTEHRTTVNFSWRCLSAEGIADCVAIPYRSEFEFAHDLYRLMKIEGQRGRDLEMYLRLKYA